VAVCAIPFALAQRNASKRSVAKPNLSAIAKLRQTAPPLTRAISAPAATDISKTGQLQLPHHVVTGASAAIPGGVCQFHVLIVYADTDGLPTQLQSEIQAEPNVVAVDLFDATVGTPTLGQLQQYEIVVPFSNSPFLDGDTLGNNLADYVDGGGIVVQHGFSHLGPGEPYGINGRWVSGNYNPYDYSENFAFNPIHTRYLRRGPPTHGGCHQPQQRLPEHCDTGGGSNGGSGYKPRHFFGSVSSRQWRAYHRRRYSLCRSRCYTKR
jgi:hypothetical protein